MAFVSVGGAALLRHSLRLCKGQVCEQVTRESSGGCSWGVSVAGKTGKRRTVVATSSPSEDDDVTGTGNVNDALLRDAQRFRAAKKSRRTQAEVAENEQRPALQAVINTVLVWDFFAVCALLAWLAVAVVLHYASHNDVLLDPWLSIWSNVTQPLLGILMLAAISQGASSFFSSNNKDQ